MEVTVVETVEKIVDVPIVKQIEVPQIQTIEKIVEVPYIQQVEKIVEIPQMGPAVEGQRHVQTVHLPTVRQEAPPEHEQVTVVGAPLPPETLPAQVFSGAPVEPTQAPGMIMEPIAMQAMAAQ